MMRCHYTSIVMDKIKDNDNKKFSQECRDTGSLIHYSWKYKMEQIVWEIFQKPFIKLKM